MSIAYASGDRHSARMEVNSNSCIQWRNGMEGFRSIMSEMPVTATFECGITQVTLGIISAAPSLIDNLKYPKSHSNLGARVACWRFSSFTRHHEGQIVVGNTKIYVSFPKC